MNEAQRAAFVMAQAVEAMAQILGMHADNERARFDGGPPVYQLPAFQQVAAERGLDHNSIISYLLQGG